MSPGRRPRRITAEQEPYLMARSFATTYSSGYLLDPHSHPWHQLLFASTGAMTAFVARASWMIPPGRAVFIPAGVEHSIRMWGDVAMRSLYFPPSGPFAAAECRVIAVSPLLRELILRVVELAALDSRRAEEARLMSVLADEIDAAPPGSLALPLPADARALAAARVVLENPAEETTADVLARRCGSSARTLERLFRAETGMRFGLWRQKARLLESVRLLAEGASVTQAALDCGYTSISAYIVAFKATFGCTPGTMVNP